MSEENPFTILCVGRLTPAKGQHLLLEACASLRDWGRRFHLIIVGSGPTEAALRAATEAHDLSGSVHFAGQLSSEHVAQLYRSSDVFALPTVADSCPEAISAAMANGLPCITTRHDESPLAIRHGINGMLVAPCDVSALAETLLQLMDDPGLRQRLGQAARQHALAG